MHTAWASVLLFGTKGNTRASRSGTARLQSRFFIVYKLYYWSKPKIHQRVGKISNFIKLWITTKRTKNSSRDVSSSNPQQKRHCLLLELSYFHNCQPTCLLLRRKKMVVIGGVLAVVGVRVKVLVVDTALQGVLALARVAAKLHVPIVVTQVPAGNFI